jgi:hypothetical protein
MPPREGVEGGLFCGHLRVLPLTSLVGSLLLNDCAGPEMARSLVFRDRFTPPSGEATSTRLPSPRR